VGNGQLDKHKGGGELPGVNKFGGGVDTVTVLLEGDGNGPGAESKPRVELTALDEVIKEGVEDLVEEAGALPEVISAVDGLMRGVALGEVVPGGIVTDLPEDGIQDGARIDRWAATHLQGTGSRMGVVIIDYGLDETPLVIGEVHGGEGLSTNVRECSLILSTNFNNILFSFRWDDDQKGPRRIREKFIQMRHSRLK
jgi:hypothetical protein